MLSAASVDGIPRCTNTLLRVPHPHDPGFRVERVDLHGGRAELRFGGQLRFRQCFASWQSVRRLARPPAAHLAFDLSAVDTLDGAATALLLELRDEVVAAGGDAEIVGAHGGVRAMLDLYGSHPPRPSLHPPPAPIGTLDEIGRETLAMLSESRGLDFIGDVAVAGARAVRAPRSVNWREVLRLMERAGADSLPIVLMINFLVGLVTAFQAAVDRVKSIVATIGDINRLSGEVSEAVEQQNAATSEIARNVQQAAEGTRLVTTQIADVSAEMGQSGAAARSMQDTVGALSAKAETLTAQISGFLKEVRAA